jgi:hypothetical protein
MSEAQDYSRFNGVTSEPRTAHAPLEQDTIRRFVQAVMDDDPLYYDQGYAGTTRYGGVVAPPLFPVHAFRRPPGSPDPLDALKEDRDADGSGGVGGVAVGLPAIDSPYKRLLNGGNEIEFFRCLRVGETAVSTSKYHDVSLKEGKSGKLLVVVIETEVRTQEGDLLLVNRQSLIWR